MNELKPNQSPPSSLSPPLHIILISKPPCPGFVKTRLTGQHDPVTAALLHQAMLQCVIDRVTHLVTSSPHKLVPILAMTSCPTHNWPTLIQQTTANAQLLSIPEQPDLDTTIPAMWRIIDQGAGDLGSRIDHVWQNLISDGPPPPVMLLGIDAPDIPQTYLKQAINYLDSHDATLGPAADGGYYTLATARYYPQLLQNIDWGTSSVYHQTIDNAEKASINMISLPRWYDVDLPEDLEFLLQRIQYQSDPHLIILKQRLESIMRD